MMLLGSSPAPAEPGLATKVDSLSAKIFHRNLQQAQTGDTRAQLEIARRLETGKGTKEDLAQAVFWYRKAAEQGVAEAQYKLATMFETGTGAAKNLSQARQWYEKAATQAYRPAVAKIALLAKTERKAKQEAEQQAKAHAKRQEQRKARQKAEAQAALAAQKRSREVARLRAEREKQARTRQKQDALQLKQQQRFTEQRVQKQRKAAEHYKQSIVPPVDPQQTLALLIQGDWLNGNAAVDFLPSSLSRCIRQGNKLACFTGEREVLSTQKSVRYMAQSTVEATGPGLITVRYRYQVTRVRGAGDGLETHRGPDHPLPTKGWQSVFIYQCRLVTDSTLECRNNSDRHITLTRDTSTTVAEQR